MYHLLSGLYEYLTRKEEFGVLILGLDGAGKTVRSSTYKRLVNGPSEGVLILFADTPRSDQESI